MRISERCISLFLAGAIGAFCMTPGQLALSQFLTGETHREKDEKRLEAPRTNKELPHYIARNIKAAKVSNIRGAVQVTWDVHPGFDGEFIIGRTSEIPYNSERALRAKSIKVVPAVAESSIIDPGLPPGEYYYVILSREKIKDRDVELYPDVNYTSVPVVIEKEIPSAAYKVAPEQVTLIHAMVINKRQILLTWKGVEQSGIIYTIYRSNTPLNTPEKLKKADTIATISDGSESFLDKSLTRSGNYFYAVTVKDLSGNEDVQLIPDQSYTASGVFVAIGQKNVVTDITGKVTYDGSVRLIWNGVSFASGEYLIYRSKRPINNAQRVALSELAGTVGIDSTEYIDSPGKGQYYYAVLVRMPDGSTDTTLIEGSNYLQKPVRIGRMLRLSWIAARARQGKVQVQWRYRGETPGGTYQLIRATKRVNTVKELDNGKVVGPVNIRKKKYIDRSPPVGMLYYALVPEGYKTASTFKVRSGINVAGPVQITGTESAPERDSIEEYGATDVDTVLRSTFFPGRYREAIKKLENIAGQSDNEYEIAKARLFIGRSWLELRRYKKALSSLLQPEVKKFFPDEARFWSEYALSRVR